MSLTIADRRVVPTSGGVYHVVNHCRQESSYTPVEVAVADAAGEGRFRCRCYQRSVAREACPPSPHYKDVIVRGARQNRLPAHYLRFLDTIQDNGFQGDVLLYNKVMELLPK